jgi:PPK2 family polyphosphate:nucleotide phosphotransferase
MKFDADRFRIEPGKRVRLRKFDPDDTAPFKSRSEVEGRLQKDLDELFRLQELLHATQSWSMLLVFQAMDAAGKDSAIKHVMRGLNPQGTRVASFKSPSSTELAHTFLWRVTDPLPERGQIGVFNRSHYEEVLIVRVHPEILEGQRLPRELVGKKIWQRRYEDINAFEKHLARNGTVIRKFFLHVSKDEQRRQFLERLDEPAKNYKFSMGDVKERERWDDYMEAYEEALSATSTAHAPWYVVPADHKWFTQLVIARVAVKALAGLDLAYPKPSAARQKELEAARALLASGRKEGKPGKPDA